MLRRARSFLELENAELALKIYYKHEYPQRKKRPTAGDSLVLVR